MGSNDHAAERPPHKIYLDAYYIDRYPVTNTEYKKFVDATRHRTPTDWKNGQFPVRKDGCPVVYVTWEDASAYARWAGKRLPSEAKWEKAARGTDGRKYPWGNQPPDERYCNFGQNVGETTPVDRYSAQGDSPYGVSDMAGNVWEWCLDFHDPNYYNYSPPRNPRGPAAGLNHVLRGGSWLSSQNHVRTTNRSSNLADYRGDFIGFRCAQSA